MSHTNGAASRRRIRLALDRRVPAEAFCRTNGCATQMLPRADGQLSCPICGFTARPIH